MKVQKLLSVEDGLNKDSELYYLGSLNSDYFRFIHKNVISSKDKSLFGNVLTSIGYIFKFFIISYKKDRVNKDIEILIGKSGNKKHHNNLADYLLKDYPQSAQFDTKYTDVFRSLTRSSRLRIVLRLSGNVVKAYTKVKKASKINEIELFSGKLVYNLVVQLIRFEAAKLYLSELKSLKLIMVDYDRSVFTPLVLAANKRNIKTVSFQHGVVNPPYGYHPIIANEIWVWGKIWKDILIKMKVEKSRIKIVGSSIIEDSFDGSFSGEIKVIGIGPNPIGNDINFILWNKLIQKLEEMNFDVIVKLHPSMKNDTDVKRVFGNSARIFESSQLSNSEFFQSIDLLVVSNSGLGYEAIVNNTLVAVNRQVGSSGNDHIMLEAGKFPELTESLLKSTLTDIQNNYVEYLCLEKKFVTENIFYKTGNDARASTKKLINEYLYEMVDQ